MKKVSIIMGIYNCEDTLKDAVDSLVAQTYQNWELIMCDDASKDNTYAIAQQFQMDYPDKIILLKNSKNMGLNYTLNRCLSVATGEYIARMDGDDTCSPNRFETEIEALNKESGIAIVSSDMEYFDDTGVWGIISHVEYPDKPDFIYGSPFCHAACMVRKEAYDAVNGYSVENRLLRVEDYHLWIKMYSKGFRGKNIHQALYQMRDDRNAYKRRKFRYRINEAYVKFLAVKMLNLPKWNLIYVLKPIAIGILPNNIYDFLHRYKLNKK